MTIETLQVNHTNHDPWYWEGRAMPIGALMEVIAMLPYGNSIRVGLQLLFYTGCRLSELKNMKRSDLVGNVIYWRMGKNQTMKGHRRERLPDALVKELEAYWERNRMPQDRVYHTTGETLSRRFNGEIRPLLSKEWHDKVRTRRSSGFTWEYAYQLKGCRKMFATLIFTHYYTKFKDAYVAGEMVSKRMKHSDTGITWHHYILCAEQIEAQKYLHLMPFEITSPQAQSVLMEFGC